MGKRVPECRLCGHEHWSYQSHKLIGGPEPSKDVKRLVRPSTGRVVHSRSQALVLDRVVAEIPADLATAYDGIGPLSPENARLLTDRLKADFAGLAGRADELARALELAQRRGAWRALGYASWNEYVEAEFEISKRHANRLVSHQRFAAMLEGSRTPEPDTSGTNGPTLTEGQTRAVRSDPITTAKIKRMIRRGVSPKMAVDKITGGPCEHPRTVSVTVCADCGRRLGIAVAGSAPEEAQS